MPTKQIIKSNLASAHRQGDVSDDGGRYGAASDMEFF
jgi:hypothetical protein